MGVKLDGDNITIPGQGTVEGLPTSPNHLLRNKEVTKKRAFVQNLDMNAAAPVDLTSFSVNSSKQIPTRVVVCNASADVSGASLGLYSASGGGGVEIVAPTALSSLTAAGKFQVLSVASLTDPITATTLYPRLTVAHGSAGTVDLVYEYEDISDL